MAGLAALMASPALSVQKAPAERFTPIPQSQRKKPPRLRPGDTIGLIEPASNSDEDESLTIVEETITAMGLKPKRAPNLLAKYGYLAGEDKARASDVNAMFADPQVRAIFAVRGGWGCARMLPYLDFGLIRKNPKMLLGFSDITALHLAIAAKGGAITLHGPNGGSRWGKLSVGHLKTIAFDAQAPLLENPVATEDRLVQRNGRIRTLRGGKARGPLLGGNLTIVASLVGTPYMPDFKGAILFLEDVDEAEYRIDRMLTQLTAAGILGQLAGLVFGQCTDCRARNGTSFSGFTLSQVLDQHLKPLNIPVYQGAFFGHIADQMILPVGGMAEIDADAGTIRLLEPAVS
jgi:muramoyltetrapeptide carboxypeptidase